MKTIYRVALMTALAALLTSLPVLASDSDDRIETSAKNSYVFKTFLKGDDVKVQSKDGAVTLTGVVAEDSRRGLAQETVAGLPGVKSVDNKLVVKGATPSPTSDTWLGEKVRATLLFHRNVSGTSTNIQVTNGVVTLSGEASSKAQKELTTEYAKDVDGVKDVRNEMTVAAAKKPEDKSKTMGETVDNVGVAIDDASITAQVKMSLLFHRSTSAQGTQVVTNAGVVTLNGKAKNAAEKELVTKLVSDVNGVTRVNNLMTIG